jgi:membrane peptidoglycan carboxypeptidase
VGHSAGDAKLRNNKTGGRVYGNGLPRDFWAEFMTGALKGSKHLDFPPPKYTGLVDSGNVASPEPVPSVTVPTQEPSTQPRMTESPPEWPIPSDQPGPPQDASPSPRPDPLFPSDTTSGSPNPGTG